MSETNLEMALKAWRLLMEDDAYRLDFPQDYYDTLIERADELLQQKWIDEQDCELLKTAAEQAYAFTLDSLSRNQRECLSVGSMRLPRGEQ